MQTVSETVGGLMSLENIRSPGSLGSIGPRHDDRSDQDHVRLRRLRATRRVVPSGPAPRVATSSSKRLMDILISATALVVLGPLLLLIALAIRLETRGPAIFRQRRGGLCGRPFIIYKFRTMSAADDGDDVQHATRQDGRVTSLGAFLRRSSLDELPQLINVLKGDMSLVGPRPHALAHDDYYSQRVPSYADRLQARPGITGLAQVSGYRGGIDRLETMARRVSHDLDYIRNWSFLLDWKILVMTVVRTPFDGQAY